MTQGREFGAKVIMRAKEDLGDTEIEELFRNNGLASIVDPNAVREILDTIRDLTMRYKGGEP